MGDQEEMLPQEAELYITCYEFKGRYSKDTQDIFIDPRTSLLRFLVYERIMRPILLTVSHDQYLRDAKLEG